MRAKCAVVGKKGSKIRGRFLPTATAIDRVRGESSQGRTSGTSRPVSTGKELPAPN